MAFISGGSNSLQLVGGADTITDTDTSKAYGLPVAGKTPSTGLRIDLRHD